jgi:hypothetical protein
MATKTHQDKPEPIHVGQRIAGLSRESEASNNSPSSRSSTSSWWVGNTARSPLEFCGVWVAHNSVAKHSDRPEYDEQLWTFQRTIVPSTSGSISWPAWPERWRHSVNVFESLLRFYVCSWNARNKTHNKLWAGDTHRVLDFVKVMSNDGCVGSNKWCFVCNRRFDLWSLLCNWCLTAWVIQLLGMWCQSYTLHVLFL